MTTRPPQSIVSAAAYVSAPGPTAAIESPAIATAPDRWMVNDRSSVSSVALMRSVSQRGGMSTIMPHRPPVRHATTIVSVVPLSRVVNCRSGDEAGPCATAPLVVNCDPWQGHT